MVLWVLKVLTRRGAGGCARSRRQPYPHHRCLAGACARGSLRACL